jgi:hypothetical protein
MNINIHWYKPHDIIYWNARDLATPPDLLLANSTLLTFLEEGHSGDTHILMDLQHVTPEDAITDGTALKENLTFTKHPNIGMLVVFNAADRNLTAAVALLAYSNDLALRLVNDLPEALAALGFTRPIPRVPRW